MQALRYSSGYELSVLYSFQNIICVVLADSRMGVGIQVRGFG